MGSFNSHSLGPCDPAHDSRALVRPRAHNHKKQDHRLTCSMREGSTSALVSVTRPPVTRRVPSAFLQAVGRNSEGPRERSDNSRKRQSRY